MTILEHIRSKPGLTVGVVAGALLLFLVPFDSISNWVQGTDASYTGKINGVEVSNAEYSGLLTAAEQQMKNSGQDVSNVHQQVWENMIMNKLIEKRFYDLGLEMNDDYFWNSIETPKSEYENALKDPKNAEFAENWKLNNQYILMTKAYSNFIMNGLNANKAEVAMMKKANNEVANFDYIKIDFNEYAKKANYKVTDQDLQKYIDKHQMQFKREAQRSFYVVQFKNSPSAKDLQWAQSNMLAYLNGGMIKDENGNNLDSIVSFRTKGDSAYVAMHSMYPYYNDYIKQADLQSFFGNEVVAWANAANSGDVYGPFTKTTNDGKTMNILSKMVEKRMSDSIQSKHILITTKQTNPQSKYSQEQAYALADSIKKAIDAKPELFDAMVAKYSEDPGSKLKAGDVGFSSENKPIMDQSYQQFIEKNPVGKVGIIPSQFGMHIVKVTQKLPVKPMKYKLLNLVKQIEPSEATSNVVFNNGNKFFETIKGKDLNAFKNAAKKFGKNAEEVKNISRFAKIQQLNSDKDNEILKWAFNSDTKEGETNLFSTNAQDYIAVYLNGVYKEGIATPAQVRSEIETTVRNEILAEKLAEKINSGKKSLDQLAAEYGVAKASGQISMLNPSIAGSFEPKVAGAAFGVKTNTVSKAVKGTSGVYVLVTKSIGKNPSPMPMDDKQLQEQISQRNKQSGMNLIQRTIRQEAEIVDNRNNVYK